MFEILPHRPTSIPVETKSRVQERIRFSFFEETEVQPTAKGELAQAV